MKKKILVIISFLILAFALSVYVLGKREENIMSSSNTSLYSYDINDTVDLKFMDILDKYEIKDLYQTFTFDIDNDYKENKLLENMLSKEIDVYHLTQSDLNLELIKDQIDLVNEFNLNHIFKIKGIVIYINNYKDSFNFENYSNIIKKSYKYAKRYKLDVILTIPYNLDDDSSILLEELIKDYSEGISIINEKTNGINNIEREVSLTKKYNKKISNVYKIDNYKTYKTIHKDFMKIKDKLEYTDLSISYFDYKSILEKSNLFK